MNESANKNSTPGASRILLIFALLILVGVGGYSLYKIFLDETVEVGENISQLPPTTAIETVQPSPSILMTVTPELTVTASPLPTNIPTATVTPKPLSTANPTQPLVSPTRAVTPTSTPAPLPVSGNVFPTIFVLALGIVLIIPILVF